MPLSTQGAMRKTASGLSYWDNGEQQGDVYVLLHGISSAAGLWAKQFASQAGKNRLIAWDAPGYGDSVALASATPMRLASSVNDRVGASPSVRSVARNTTTRA